MPPDPPSRLWVLYLQHTGLVPYQYKHPGYATALLCFELVCMRSTMNTTTTFGGNTIYDCHTLTWCDHRLHEK